MFLKARKRATVGYLNLCIAVQKLRRDQLHRQLVEKSRELSQIDLTIGRYVSVGQDNYVLQIDGQVIGHHCPVTALIGASINNVVIVPGKIINLITK